MFTVMIKNQGLLFLLERRSLTGSFPWLKIKREIFGSAGAGTGACRVMMVSPLKFSLRKTA